MLGASQALLFGSSAAGQTYGGVVDLLNPISHWPLAALADRKGLSNLAAFGSHETSLPPIAQQDDDFARGFNGTDAYATIAHNAAYQVAAGGVFVLMQPDTVAAKMQVFNSGVSAAGSMALEVEANGQPRAYRYRSDGTAVIVTGSSGQIVAGTSYLYGVTWGPSGLRLWLMDASLSPGLVASDPETSWATITDTATKYLGRWSGSPIDHFDGVLGHLQFYGSELSQAQIESIAVPQPVVWLPDIDAGSVTANESKFIDFAPHAHPVSGFTPAVLSQPSLGTAAAVGLGVDYDAGATEGDNDTFTARITAGGVDSRTATVTINVVPVGEAVDVGALAAFTRSTIDVTALAGWPSGRMPQAVLQQGARASAYIRRAWKPTLNTGTHLDFIPGWQKTTAQETIRLQLDDDSEIDLTYTVEHPIPSPTGGGVTRTLDRTATPSGTTYNTWASAIAALTSGDVLLVRAPAGTWTDSGGHAIPNFVYDVTTSPAPASGVHNVTVIAHPDDVAAGRRPVIWRNAGRYARFKYAPVTAWQVHADLGSGRVIYQSATTFTAPTHSLFGAYRDQIGDWIGLYNPQAMNDGTDRSGVLHDTASTRYTGVNNVCYMGPSCLHNRVTNRLEVRLDAPPKASFMNPNGAAPYPPWDWTKHYPASTDPRLGELVFTDGDSAGNWNYLLDIGSRNGWEFYNLDFIYGNSALNNGGAAIPPQFFGCNFLGGAGPDVDNNGTDADFGNTASTVRNAGTTVHTSDMLFDRCNLYGTCPPWGSWTEGKGNEGAYGISVRREITGFLSARAMFRYSRLLDWYHFVWSASSPFTAPAKFHWHHCYINGCSQDGGMVCTQGNTDFVVNRNFMPGAVMYGPSGTGGGTGILRHASFNVELRLHALLISKPNYNKWANSGEAAPDTPSMVHNWSIGHGGHSINTDRKYYNTHVGTQNTYNVEMTNATEGCGSNIGPDARGENHRVFNCIGAVWPSPCAWPGGVSNFCALYSTKPGCQYDYNVLFKHANMLAPGAGSTAFVRTTTALSSGGGTNYADIAALRSGTGFETNGVQADPQFVATPTWITANPYAGGGAWDMANYMLGPSSPARTGGRNLNDQNFPDYDFDTIYTWIGGNNALWRGALDPNAPFIEQEVGIVGPLPPEIV